MFAQLGDIKFDLPVYFEGLSDQQRAKFASHDRIEGKPLLQWVGEELDQIDVTLVFHSRFCNPEFELAKLRTAKSRHEALPLIYGNGSYPGDFVLTEIRERARQMSGIGELVSIEAQVQLLEWADDGVHQVQGEALTTSPRAADVRTTERDSSRPDTAEPLGTPVAYITRRPL